MLWYHCVGRQFCFDSHGWWNINLADIIFENCCNWKESVCFKVMQWGRSLYTNIQRFVQFRLTVSASALIICVVVAVHSHEIPLNVAQVIFSLCIANNSLFLSHQVALYFYMQLLWVNLLIDTFGALALASEPPIDNLMRRPPVRKGYVNGSVNYISKRASLITIYHMTAWPYQPFL